MSKKEKFPLYLSPEKKAILERRYQEDGSRSITAFIERAVDFYLDYLSANNAGLFLPTSIKSYLDGRMGQLEERLSSIAFRQAVEQDMVAGILADAYQFSSEDLRRRRAESVQNVKKTNGRISLEQRVRGAWEEDDEWQPIVASQRTGPLPDRKAYEAYDSYEAEEEDDDVPPPPPPSLWTRPRARRQRRATWIVPSTRF